MTLVFLGELLIFPRKKTDKETGGVLGPGIVIGGAL